MKFIVEEGLLSKTKCEYEFSCLESDQCACGDKMCTVFSANGENVLFLQDQGNFTCSFLIYFGGSAICRCPVRYAIYRKYGK